MGQRSAFGFHKTQEKATYLIVDFTDLTSQGYPETVNPWYLFIDVVVLEKCAAVLEITVKPAIPIAFIQVRWLHHTPKDGHLTQDAETLNQQALLHPPSIQMNLNLKLNLIIESAYTTIKSFALISVASFRSYLFYLECF